MSANRLYQTIAAKLRKLIEDGEFPPGSRLPGERELARRFGVSRVTIRKRDCTGGTGVDCNPYRFGRAREAASDAGVRRAAGCQRLRPHRCPRGIRGRAAALAASNLDDAGIAELQALAEALCRRDLSDAEAGEYDRRFHLTIARLSGNPVVEFFVQQIWRMRSELPRVTEVYARVCHDDGASRADEHGHLRSIART